MAKYRTIKLSLLVIAIVAIICVAIYPTAAPLNIAIAADVKSDVLDDLKSDSTFDASDYPANKTDYSVKLIQIAEGEHGDLFIYTYQPSDRVKSLGACKINMALGETVDGTKLYDLQLVNRNGVFCKYEVVDFKVDTEKKTRYYNISAIYRNWVSGIDNKADADKNVINSVAFKVGQLWTATTEGDTVKYSAKEVEVVKITSQMIGMQRFSEGFQFANTKICDSHYIAFTCDHKIDHLRSADIEFVTTPYKNLQGSGIKYGNSTPQKVTLYDFQTASNNPGGWFGKQEEWHRMTSVNDYIKEVELSEGAKTELQKYDWILNFYETEYSREVGGKDILISLLVPFGFIDLIVQSCTTTGTVVSEVSLLRLEFDYDGKIYNLGVVSDAQSGDPDVNNEKGSQEAAALRKEKIRDWFKGLFDLPDWADKLIKALIIIAIIVLIVFIFFPVFRALGRLLTQNSSKRTRKKPKRARKKPKTNSKSKSKNKSKKK